LFEQFGKKNTQTLFTLQKTGKNQ